MARGFPQIRELSEEKGALENELKRGSQRSKTEGAFVGMLAPDLKRGGGSVQVRFCRCGFSLPVT
jgi:hypothetical protein